MSSGAGEASATLTEASATVARPPSRRAQLGRAPKISLDVDQRRPLAAPRGLARPSARAAARARAADVDQDDRVAPAKCNSGAVAAAKMSHSRARPARARGLRVTGTKSELAPRLLVALQAEAELGNAPPTATAAAATRRCSAAARTAVPVPRRPPPRARRRRWSSRRRRAAAAGRRGSALHAVGRGQPGGFARDVGVVEHGLRPRADGARQRRVQPARRRAARRASRCACATGTGSSTWARGRRSSCSAAASAPARLTASSSPTPTATTALASPASSASSRAAASGRAAGADLRPHGIARLPPRRALQFTGTRMLPRYVVHELHDIPDLNRRNPSTPLLMAKSRAARARRRSGASSRAAATSRRARRRSSTARGGPSTRAPPTAPSAVKAAPLRTQCPASATRSPSPASRAASCQNSSCRMSCETRSDPRRVGRARPAVPPQARRCRSAPSERLVLPDGLALQGSEVLGEAPPGRKVVVLRDCSDCSLATPIAYGADLLCHEATNAYLPRWGDTGGFRPRRARHDLARPLDAADGGRPRA